MIGRVWAFLRPASSVESVFTKGIGTLPPSIITTKSEERIEKYDRWAMLHQVGRIGDLARCRLHWKGAMERK